MEREEPINPEEIVGNIYHHIPTEPVILSPHAEVIDTQPQSRLIETASLVEIDDLRQYKTLSEERFEKMGRLIADQNKMMEFLMAKLK